MSQFQENLTQILQNDYGKSISCASKKELYMAICKAALCKARPVWNQTSSGKQACYFSAEFLIGRMIYSNLLNLGLLKETDEILRKNKIDIREFEDVEDAALGNGGLGRLAACFLDSAATQGFALNGYGIRYRYGLFRQYFQEGFQKEVPDTWESFGDPWSVRKEEEKVKVCFGDQIVYAVPYDMPVIGYGTKCVNTLRLWQAEAVNDFDFDLFNRQKYREAVEEKDLAEAISSVLYPNDDTKEGKKLRLKQQYFFSSASLQSIVKDYSKRFGEDFSDFANQYAIQLNDTHPVISTAELLRILMAEKNMNFEQAFSIVKNTFAYTNHTVMAEALEKWDVSIFREVLPEVYPYIVMINNALKREMSAKGISDVKPYEIISNGMVHMARLAVFATHSTNGVAKIHTDILKQSAMKEWFLVYPERFNNKTNGITQRRWLALCNPELSEFITERIGSGWITNLTCLKELEKYKQDNLSVERYAEIKKEKKNQLAAYVTAHDNFNLNTEFLFDVQVKRLHEYKRQLLNAFSILDIYFGIKSGRVKDFYPTAFIFGGKAAPGYYRAKGIIKFINEIADKVNYDNDVNRKMQVVFLQNYNVSYAEKIIPAADVSEQISTAGTEASGTSNMKFMLNGAVTLGTYDGANIEIVEQSGEENNYIFGARVEDLERIKEDYNPKKLYEENERIKQVVDTLVNGTFNDGGTGMFRELYTSLLDGASWHKADNYYLFLDFIPYCDARLRVNRDYAKNRLEFEKKCLMNTANAGIFSSDRTIKQYAHDIWNID